MNHFNGIDFASLFSAKDILCQSKFKERDDVMKELLRLLAYNYGIGDVDEAFEAVLAREKQMSTLLVPGLAIPHARLSSLDKVQVAIATSKEGIKYRPEKEGVAHVVILILTPKDQPGAYLQAVGSLGKIFHDQELIPALANLGTAIEVWSFFEKGELIVPDHIQAKDLMVHELPSLNESDTLEQAIDLLVKCHRINIPVIDAQNVLIGVVSAFELLRIALPDYILWMEDLSPILNFEPFSEIMKNESKTWLSEIMTFEFPVVQADAPAILVAKEMTKFNSTEVWVLDGDKLVGMISLQDFIHKILRE